MYIEDATLIAVVTTTTTILVKGVDVLVTYLRNRNSCETSTKELRELKTILLELHEILIKEDETGMPLVYSPRRLLTQQDVHGDILKNQVFHTEMIVKALEKLCLASESMVRVLDRIDYKDHK